jgi:precorrin-6A/cobalt-precorrin-6A reductase
LRRPPWAAVAGDQWHTVPDLTEAASELELIGAERVFLTTGRQELAPFARMQNVWFLVRAIEMPASDLPANALVLLARGPFDETAEHALLVDHRIDALVAKNSGGAATAAKLAAARTLHIPVVMVERPAQPGGDVVESVGEACAWLEAIALGTRGQSSPGYARGV